MACFQIVEPEEEIKKPKGKSEMHFVRFYGTGDQYVEDNNNQLLTDLFGYV